MIPKSVVFIFAESTIDSEGFKGGTRGAPIMPRDAVSRTANVERIGRHKWVKSLRGDLTFPLLNRSFLSHFNKFFQIICYPGK